MKKLALLFAVTVSGQSIEHLLSDLSEIKHIEVETIRDRAFQKCILSSLITSTLAESKIDLSLNVVPIITECNKSRHKRDVDARDVEYLVDWLLSYVELDSGILDIPFPTTVQELDDKIENIIRKRYYDDNIICLYLLTYSKKK